MNLVLFLGSILVFKVIEINCHGRLVDPPARSSAWREDSNFPPYYQDNQMFCGGFVTQWKENGGRCGICGEDFSKPKLFEKGGSLYRGIIVRTYKQGSIITVGVEITANHKGYFEFRICNTDLLRGGEANEACLSRILLKDKFGKERIPLRETHRGLIKIDLQLPSYLTCERCVFQWKYHAGNSWGQDPDTLENCIGCGPQEQFYGCADVKIQARPKRNWENDNSEGKQSEDNQDTHDDSSTSLTKSLLRRLLDELKRLKKIEKRYNEELQLLKVRELVIDDNLEQDRSIELDHSLYNNENQVRDVMYANNDLEVRDANTFPDQPEPSQDFRPHRSNLNPSERDSLLDNKNQVRDVMYANNDLEVRDANTFPDQPKPSQDFRPHRSNLNPFERDSLLDNENQVRDVMYANNDLEVRDANTFPDQPKPSQDFRPHRSNLNPFERDSLLDNENQVRDVMYANNDLEVRDTITFPDQPKPSQDFRPHRSNVKSRRKLFY